jgi:hypothetical protein
MKSLYRHACELLVLIVVCMGVLGLVTSKTAVIQEYGAYVSVLGMVVAYVYLFHLGQELSDYFDKESRKDYSKDE